MEKYLFCKIYLRKTGESQWCLDHRPFPPCLSLLTVHDEAPLHAGVAGKTKLPFPLFPVKGYGSLPGAAGQRHF